MTGISGSRAVQAPSQPPAWLKWGGIGLTGAGAATALAALPTQAFASRKVGNGMLFAGLGAAMLGIGALTFWRMRQDATDAANEPGVQPGGGTTKSDATIPATVTGVSGPLEGVDHQHAAMPKVELATVAKDLGQLVQVTSAPGDDDGLWLVEKTGKLLRRGADGKVETKLDISPIVDGGGERGLLSVAFHPRFESNGRLFLYYTEKGSGEIHIAEAHAGRGGTVERDSLKDLITIDHPRGNHNGGQLQFGPDGMLYAGTGDGGAGGDPDDNAQNLGAHLGKILRFDVDNPAPGKNYGIPADNPYANTPGAQPEIYATGVRNPWRFSFDRDTGDLWIGDVGQNEWEEVDFVPRGQALGGNFGWDIREGANPYEETPQAPGTLIEPALQYNHQQGASITGGYVYRGDDIPALKGYYLYNDITSDKLRAMKVDGGKVVDRQEIPGGRDYTVGWGEGPDGELYAVTLGGELTKVVREGGAATAPGEEPKPPTGPAHRVDLTVKNNVMRFDKDEYHVPAGTVTLHLKNTDTSGMPHNIGIQGPGVGNKMSDMAFTGDEQELTVNLEPGEYQLYCAPHMGGGMVSKLIVE
jgi:glucose/arabinose dehydrogenase